MKIPIKNIKSCPMCRQKAVLCQEDKYPHQYSVFCSGCGLETAKYEAPASAANAWNIRLKKVELSADEETSW